MKDIFILLILTISTISCENFLVEDVSTQITIQSDVLNSESGLFKALVGAYKPLGQTWEKGFANAYVLAVLMGSDDLTTSKARGFFDFLEFDCFRVLSSNRRLPGIWNGCYKSIQICNNIITNYKNITCDQTNINQIAGEAYFLRGYCYFCIVRLWGEAPIVLNSHVFTEKILSKEKSSIVEIYEQVISDMKQAESLMGDVKPNTGRVNKGTAKAVLSEVYLYMAGWPLNNVSYYQLAAEKAKEVIDNESVYGFGLMEDFADLWPTEETPVVPHVEEVFSLTFWGEEWWNANAVYGSAARPSDINGWDDYLSELTFFFEFPEGYRKDVTFFTQLADGTSWQNFYTKRPYYKKFFAQDTWMNVCGLPLERMTEIYFIFAEAQVMATGNPSDSEALEAVNKIRRRAMGLPLHSPDPSVDWTSATQDQIVEEKAWEFAGEFCRWFDLVRLQKVEEVVAKKHPNDLQPRGPIQYFMPIPEREIVANPNLGD